MLRAVETLRHEVAVSVPHHRLQLVLLHVAERTVITIPRHSPEAKYLSVNKVFLADVNTLALQRDTVHHAGDDVEIEEGIRVLVEQTCVNPRRTLSRFLKPESTVAHVGDVGRCAVFAYSSHCALLVSL